MADKKYRLDTRLGGGGMAEVFLASQIGAEGFTRRVAIKRVLPGYSENPQFAQMFISEAQLSSRLLHPNIVAVTDFDRDDEGRLYLVMELVSGKDLDAILATGPLPFSVVNFVVTEMLRGLAYAHDLPASADEVRGLVHRDVSPHNVLVSWEGAVKVSDFGIAKAREASEATASVFIKGKPAYMSPEQANGEPLDGRSDLFAVGIMLWEMLVGRRLFVGGDTRSLLAQVLFSPIPRPRQQRPEVPRDLDRICMKMLEREVGARYLNGAAVISDLLQCESAPKGGREELVALLAERFPTEVPQRGSRAPSVSTPIGVATLPGHGSGKHLPPSAAAVPGQPTGRAATAPPTPLPLSPPSSLALGAASALSQPPPGYAAGPGISMGPGAVASPPPRPPMQDRETRTVMTRSRGMVTAVVASVAVVGAIVVTAILGSRGGAPTPPDGGAIAGAKLDASGAAGAGQAEAAPDAATAAAPDAAVTSGPGAGAAPDGDGKPADTTRPADGDGKPANTARPADGDEPSPAARRKGVLAISTIPSMDVYVDRKRRGAAPLKLPLAAGQYKVQLKDPESGRTVDSFSVTIEPGKENKVQRSFE